MTRSKEVFSPQAQALDLCIRLIACPIFSLPPPQILINYFRKKYGSTARDDNPNTMIEEGITNNPQPRRPIMLVSQPTSYSRRDSAYIFDSTYQERDQDLYSSCSSFEKDDDRCTRYIDEEANIGTTSSLDTAAETSPRLKSLSKLSSANLKESKTPSATSTDEAASSSLSISIPSETRITFSPQEIDLTPPPLSFAPGLDLERNEQEETALAARRISRRLTMEGRKDDLDILNITSLMKRSNRASTGAGPKSQIGNSFLSLSTPMSESSFSPSRHFSDVRASVLKRGRQNMINDSPLVEEDEELDSRSLQEPSKQVATIESLERVGGQEYAFGTMLEHDTQMDSSNNSTSSRHPIAQQLDSRDSSSTTTVTTNTEQRGDYISNTSSPISNLSSSTSSTSLPTSSSSSPVSSSSSPISKKMSMDNIRKMSRDALTSFQKGVFGPALHNPILTSGPLSPTILRTEREAYGLSVKAKDGNNEHVEHV
ncbi:hypothetical protein BGZ46_002151 [Entomortierella lignicola]|nr:hypothetical protein BGZ46_002151 [Entomortierella lignicola]